jgi:hypothetical protein
MAKRENGTGSQSESGALATIGAESEAGRFDVFISYRRIAADTDFVDYLSGALTERGKRVWVDRSRIELASDWSERVGLGVQAAKASTFRAATAVLSPSRSRARALS